MRKVIASLDIGSDSLKLVVGEYLKRKLNILAVAETPSKGIKKGLLIHEDIFLESLKEVFHKAEEIIGLKINKVIVNMPSNYTEFALSEGSCPILNESKVVQANDVVSALSDAIHNKIPANMELVSVIPTTFKVDDKTVKDPKKMIGDLLCAKCVLVSIPKKTAYTILSCFEKMNIEVVDITLGVIGDFYSHVTPMMKESVGALINVGDATTSVAIFNRGVLTNVEVVELGGQNIDNDLAFIYKLTKKDARDLKEHLALAHKRLAVANEGATYTNKLGERIRINQYEASEIVESRLEEILELAKKQINLLTKKEISYIIFTGGVTESKDFPLILESVFGKNVILGSIHEIGVRNNRYATAVGMIKYYHDKMMFKEKDFSIFNEEEQEELGSLHKRVNVSENSILGKLFGYFFDN